MSAPKRPTTIEGGFVPIVAAAHIAPCTYRYVVVWDCHVPVAPGDERVIVRRRFACTPPLWRKSLAVDSDTWARFVAQLERDMAAHPPL